MVDARFLGPRPTRCCVMSLRALVQPVGEGPVRARRVGRGARRAGGARRPRCSTRLRRSRAKASAEEPPSCSRAAGVDFAILGPRRGVHGRPGPADGERVRLQALAAECSRRSTRYGAGKDPHCFNTLAQIPDFGGSYEVVTSQWRSWCATGGSRRRQAHHVPLTRATWPATTSWPSRAEWSCGRGHRSRWSAAAGHSVAARWRAHVDGGAGAGRGAREAAETGADTLAVACPYCTCSTTACARQAATCAWRTWRPCSPVTRQRAITGSDPNFACTARGGARVGPGPGCSAYLSFTRNVTSAAGVELLAIEKRSRLPRDVHVHVTLVDHLVVEGRGLDERQREARRRAVQRHRPGALAPWPWPWRPGLALEEDP